MVRRPRGALETCDLLDKVRRLTVIVITTVVAASVRAIRRLTARPIGKKALSLSYGSLPRRCGAIAYVLLVANNSV